MAIYMKKMIVLLVAALGLMGCQQSVTQSTLSEGTPKTITGRALIDNNSVAKPCTYEWPKQTTINIRNIPNLYNVWNGEGWSFPASFNISKLGGCKTHVLTLPSATYPHTLDSKLSNGLYFYFDNSFVSSPQSLPPQAVSRASANLTFADGRVGMVTVNHGLEPKMDGIEASKKYPYGEVTVFQISDSYQIKSDIISPYKGFYHSVSVGDLNGDGLDDVVADNMGLRIPGKEVDWSNSLTAYIQNKDSTFSPKNIFSQNKNSESGGGSVLVADLNKDGKAEIVHGKYAYGFKENFQILQRRFSTYDVSKRFPSEDIACTSSVHAIDYDNDRLTDLIFATECAGSEELRIYKNLGGMNFVDNTDVALIDGQPQIRFREITVSDVNEDGYQDFVLNLWNGNQVSSRYGINFGRLVYLNQGNGTFQNLGNQRSLTINERSIFGPFYKLIPGEGLSFVAGVPNGNGHLIEVRFSKSSLDGNAGNVQVTNHVETSKAKHIRHVDKKFEIENMPPRLLSDVDVCKLAVFNSAWNPDPKLEQFVSEAKSRGLSLQNCGVSSTSKISRQDNRQFCSQYFDMNTLDWSTSSDIVQESARQRKLTPMACFRLLK